MPLNESSSVFSRLQYKPSESADMIREQINRYPTGFLPEIFNTLVPCMIEKRRTIFKTRVSMSLLASGAYHTARTNSDQHIASGIRTLLRTPELEKHNTDDLTGLVLSHRGVFYTILKLGADKKHTLSTIKSNMVKLLRLLYIAYAKDNKRYKPPIYDMYSVLMHSMGDKITEQDNNNELSTNEAGRFLDWSHIIQKQASLSHQYDAIKNKQTKEAYDINQSLLLVSLYSLTPPLRKEVMSLQFADQNDKGKTADYVKFTKDGMAVLELNLDKKRHGAISLPLSSELSDILNQSFEQYPRRYLFTDARKFPDFSTPVEQATVADRLRKLFIKHNKDIGPSILRASYVSYRFDQADWRLSMNEVEEMARLMRTSAKYIMSSYRKNTDGNAGHLEEDDEEVGAEPPEGLWPNEGERAFMRDEEADDEGEACANKGEACANKGDAGEAPKEDPYEKHNAYLVNKYKTDSIYKAKVLAQQRDYRAKKGALAVYRPKLLRLLKRSAMYRERVQQKTLDKYGITAEDYM